MVEELACSWSFLELFGLSVLVYYAVQLVLWIFLDSDIELFWKTKFGVPIKSMQGHVVWVTGASSGIGKHLAIVLAKNGVRLCISARREDELLEVKKLCLTASNDSLKSDDILVLKMDMLDISGQDDAFEKVHNHFGRIDVLVQNAGRSQRADWQEIALCVDRDLFELNVFSVVNLSRIYLKNIKTNGYSGGHIAVTSSVAGLISPPGSASYNGAKHAIHVIYF